LRVFPAVSLCVSASSRGASHGQEANSESHSAQRRKDAEKAAEKRLTAVHSRRLLRRSFLFLLPLLLVAVVQRAETYQLTQSDQAFLEDLSKRSFQYFQEQADPQTGLVLDRARTDGSPSDENHRQVASIAATGFGLTALCIGAERGWISKERARERIIATLNFLARRVPRERGWFYHWMNLKSGARVWRSEISSIDTALLVAGVLTARQAFSEDRQIATLAAKIYNDIDFRWMLNGHPTLLSHGWHPESGFIRNRWDTYSEHTMLYLMAIGSPFHSIPAESWYAWKRDWIDYGGFHYLSSGAPLFTHQYSHAWVDYRGRREIRGSKVNYFENSVLATRAHRQFCIDLRPEFPDYSNELWGITASDSERGYVAWGGPPRHEAIDGTVVPCASGGSLMFAPEICLTTLRAMRERFGARVYGRYGFVDAFNPASGWTDTDVIGIDLGITLASAENARTAKVWSWFMRNAEIVQAMQMVGLDRTK
jgi:hypothetical protein